jgi:hypothetical protein
MENTQETAQVAEQVVEQTAPVAEAQAPQAEAPQENPFAGEGKWTIKGEHSSAGVQYNQPVNQFEEAPTETKVEETSTVAENATAETPEVPVYRAEDTTESVVSSQEQATQEPIVFDPWEKLGLQEDDYAKQLIDAYKTNQLDEFLIKTNTNYDLYTDEEIIKTQIDSKYPSLGEEEKNLILQKTLQKEYGITGDEDDDKVARLMMKLEADKIRDGLKAEQSQYKPKTFENEASKFEAQLKAQQEAIQQQVESFKSHLTSLPDFKQFETNRLVEFGDGENRMNFEVDKNADFLGETLDQNKFFQKFVGQDGQLDMKKWMKAWTYANNPAAVEKSLINYGKSLGEKRLFNELKNTKAEDVVQTPSRGSGFVIKAIDGKPFGG